ncbi:CsgG/HfaB family protein [Paraglaciecola sp. 2405UD69-4]|uniref:CsgG/HfaB family protein n=1 Tax=Paraglaciecola sp. 2405UD69-4 TaxID=3391836 RepID=UPI0039C8CF1A
MMFLIRSLLTLFLLSTLSIQAFAAPRVAIVDFENRTHYRTTWRLNSGAADMLTTELVKATKLDVFERERMSSILKEQDFGQSGRIDPSTAAEIGRLIGVDFIVTGAITEFGISNSGGGGGGINIGKKNFMASVDVRIIDVNTGQIVFADTGSGTKTSTNVKVFGFGGGEKNNTKNETASLRRAMKDLARKIGDAKLENKLSSTTTNPVPATSSKDTLIAYIDDDEVTLNKGFSSNLEVGKTYKVRRPTGSIKDPKTGRVIKVKYKTLGKVKITAVEDSYSDGILVENKGVEVGDVVAGPKNVAKVSKPKPAPVQQEPAYVAKKETPPEPKVKEKSSITSFATSVFSNKGSSNVTTRSHDIEIDAYDEDALEDYYNALKDSISWMSMLAGLTQDTAGQTNLDHLNMIYGMFTGKIETSKIELEDWPLEAKQQGWKILGKKIIRYSKLFDKHRARIIKNDAIDADYKDMISDIELITEESLFEA